MSNKEKEYKKINARIMKWRQMQQNGLYKDEQLLKRRVRKGIPTSLRIKMWPELVKSKKRKEEKSTSYSTVLIKQSRDIYDINLDIPRTFSFQSQQVLRQSLFNVLKALSIEFPKIGYCQGMNFLTMRLLQVMDDDTVFYILNYIFINHKSICTYPLTQGDNFSNPYFVNRQNYVYMKLLKENIPKVFSILKEQNIEAVLYTPPWFLTLFSKSLKSETFYRFFQCFLVEGYVFVYKMALALVKLKEKEILENSMEENFLFMPNVAYYDNFTNDKIIETANQWQFTNEIIQKMEKEFSNSHKKQIQKIEQQIDETYEKKVMSPPRTLQWTIEDFRNTQVSLVQFDDE